MSHNPLIKNAAIQKIIQCGGSLAVFSNGYDHYARNATEADFNAYNTMSYDERRTLLGDRPGPGCYVQQSGRF